MTALELYSQGRPIKSIARELCISIATVGRLLRESNYTPTRIGGTRLMHEQVSKASQMNSDGLSWRAISAELGPSTKALKRAVEQYAAQRTD